MFVFHLDVTFSRRYNFQYWMQFLVWKAVFQCTVCILLRLHEVINRGTVINRSSIYAENHASFCY